MRKFLKYKVLLFEQLKLANMVTLGWPEMAFSLFEVSSTYSNMGGGAEKKEASSSAPSSQRRQVTLEELSKHRTPSDAWMTMKGK